MDARLTEIHNGLPIDATLDPMAQELRSLIKDRWSELTSQQRKALEAALTELGAASESIRADRASRDRAASERRALTAQRGPRVIRESL